MRDPNVPVWFIPLVLTFLVICSTVHMFVREQLRLAKMPLILFAQEVGEGTWFVSEQQ